MNRFGENFKSVWPYLKDAGIFHSFSEGTFGQLYFGHCATFYSSQLVILQWLAYGIDPMWVCRVSISKFEWSGEWCCKNDFSSCDVISEFAESSQATKWLKREMVGHLTRWELKRRKRKNIFFFLSLSLQMAINLRNNERCCTIHWQYFNQKRNSRNRLFFSISISRAFASENRKVWIETKFISGQMQKKIDRIMAFQTLPL